MTFYEQNKEWHSKYKIKANRRVKEGGQKGGINKHEFIDIPKVEMLQMISEHKSSRLNIINGKFIPHSH